MAFDLKRCVVATLTLALSLSMAACHGQSPAELELHPRRLERGHLTPIRRRGTLRALPHYLALR